jgi:hypothetical protein
MESSEPFRFCRVCLVPEESKKVNQKAANLQSIFVDNGRMAKIIFDLSGIVACDVDKKVPSLICKSCEKQAVAAEAFRKKILQANEHFVLMTAGKEFDLFTSRLKKLKKSAGKNEKEAKRNDEKTKKKNLDENMLKFFENSSTFYVPQVYLNRHKKPKKRVTSIEENLDVILDELTATSEKPMEAVETFKVDEDLKGWKREWKVEKTPETFQVLQPTNWSVKIEDLHDNFEMEKKIIASESQRTPTKKKLPQRPPVTYNCHRCPEFYFTMRELEHHYAFHECKCFKEEESRTKFSGLLLENVCCCFSFDSKIFHQFQMTTKSEGWSCSLQKKSRKKSLCWTIHTFMLPLNY